MVNYCVRPVFLRGREMELVFVPAAAVIEQEDYIPGDMI